MNCLEVISMFANIATVAAMIFAGIAILMTRTAINLQGKSIQAQLFSDISSRIKQLEDQFAECVSISEKKQWYERLFNAFEYFAFFANQKAVSPEMRKYYRSGIITYVDRLANKTEYADLFVKFKQRPKEELSELRKYYESETGKNLPF